MIRLLLLSGAALVWLSPASINAQVKPAKAPLELTAEIISQSYCAASSDSLTLEMDLKVRYRNVGNQKLILYQGHDLFYQTRIRAASGPQPYEVLFLNSRYFDQEFESIDQAVPGKVFVSLSPGSVYERKLLVGIALAPEGVERGNSAIAPGDHTLQLIVSTWYKPRSLAEKLRQQWAQKGLLWFDPLVSVPIHFLAARPPAPVPCKRPS
ncbi:MAG TPA: hypothetical protein VLQ90_08755 [Pyrinomonadaceae bacterium]|nr:hypothetical protein [Pyrinomonadaceae bacterium]